MAALVAALVVAAVLLAPWPMRFALDARDLYRDLHPAAVRAAEEGGRDWLAKAGFLHQRLRDANAPPVRRMSDLSALLARLLVVETFCWLLALALES